MIRALAACAAAAAVALAAAAGLVAWAVADEADQQRHHR